MPALGSDFASRLVQLNAEYARVIDNGELERWPAFFLDSCLYKVTTAENHASGLESGLIYADSRAMLADRISALREANIYERQRYRHIVGLPAVIAEADGTAEVETPFVVVRIMRDGRMDLFATGRYLDQVATDAAGQLKFRQRVAVCDSGRFDTLVALPL